MAASPGEGQTLTRRHRSFPPLSILVILMILAVPVGAQEVEVNGVLDDPTGTRALVLPGDMIELEIWNEEDMSGEYTVDETGHVTLPNLGRFQVGHLTAGELRDTLLVAFSEYLRNPAVDITILRRIGVIGEVVEPTLYWVDLTMTVRDAIALAGGLTPQGNPGNVILVRGGERIEFKGADSAAMTTAELRSGDQIVVARKSWFALNAPWVISTGITVSTILYSIFVQ
ncbi:MAG: polysaccharide biosynthesis/export family protein [Gemmatimonadota bacterium]